MQNPASSNTARRVLAASLLAAFATLGANAATLTWDSSGAGGASPVGGAGTWNTTNTNWSTGSANVSWNNANGDNASLGGAGATITLGAPIVVNNLSFDNSSGNYTVAGTGSNTLTVNGSIGGSSGTVTARILGANLTKIGGGTLTLNTAANGYTGNTLIQGGSLVARASGSLPATTNVIIGNNATSATLSIRTAIVTVAGIGTSGTGTANKIQSDANNAANSTSTLVVNPSGATSPADSTFAGAIQNGAADRILALTKAGSNTLTLTGTNSYTGLTTVSGGTLRLGSNLAGNGVTISGGTLAGNDSSANIILGTGAVSMSGATSALAPGGVGFAGAFTLGSGQDLSVAGGTLNFDLGAASDQISGSGGGLFSISGSTLLSLNLLSGFSYNNTYNLFSGFGEGSTITGLSITGYDTANWAAALGADGVLSFTATAVPEPSSAAALFGALALSAVALRRRRRD